MKKNNIKLLSPVGSQEVLKSAVFAGCDYVYLSGLDYGARNLCNNFNKKQLLDAIDFCHDANVKVFVTVNILILESEFVNALNYVYWLYINGVDAVIIQDIGLASAVSKFMPDLEIHASTQMTIYDYSFIKWLNDFGFSNVNLSREVPLKRIIKINKKLNENNESSSLEIFCHGALCYSYSGQCLMSSFMGGRSGNRGLCAQPCRLKYTLETLNGKNIASDYLLSTKDLCTYDMIDELAESSCIDSIKIEGRMKDSQYVSCITNCYRNALDNTKENKDQLIMDLAFNREFSEGYVSSKKSFDVVSRNKSGFNGLFIGTVSDSSKNKIEIEFDKNLNHDIELVNGDGLKFEAYDGSSTGSGISNIMYQNKNKILISNSKHLTISKGSKVYINYSKLLENESKDILKKDIINKKHISLDFIINNERELTINAYSNRLEKQIVYETKKKFEYANNKPLRQDAVAKQLKKTGNTNYIIDNITFVNFSNDLFMPISEINEVRREIIKKVNDEIKNSHIPNAKKQEEIKIKINSLKNKNKTNENNSFKNKISVYINNASQVNAINDFDIDTIYYDGSFNYKTIKDYLSNVYKDITKINKKIKNNTELVWVLPRLLLDEDIPDVCENILKLRIHNDINIKIQTDNIGVASCIDTNIYGNYLNIYNNHSIKTLKENPGFKRLTLSPELSKKDLELIDNNDIDLELLIFGNIEIMISEDNFSDLINKNESNKYNLVDSKGHEFLLAIDCYDHSHIFDYRLINLEEHLDFINNSNITNMSIDCRFMSFEDTYNILKHFTKIMNNKKDLLKIENNENYFTGNFEKGVYVMKK